ncbi:hypothetical protein [Aestuariivivens insulae]|uniref:hypothetical protein n=1 Tax=Aestuariivivens insulae TaxID=1621988 RepID=UPI001F56F834|nr:hypothetical protein [Aestuariivivens insulae]
MNLNQIIELKSNKKYLLIKILLLFILLHFFADFLCKLDYYSDIEFPPMNRILKGVFLCFSLCYSIYNFVNHKHKNIFLLFPLIFAFYIFKVNDYKNLETFIRYFFWLGVLPLFYDIYLKKEYSIFFKDKVYFIFRSLILFNIIIIIVDIMLGFNYTKTYNGTRFGYNGILLNQMQTPYFYLTLLFVFQKKKNSLLLIMVAFLSILSGIKAAYLGLFLFLIFKIGYINKNKISYKKQVISIGVVVTIFVFWMYLFLQTKIFSYLRETHGIITALTSERNLNLKTILNELDNQNFNFFIGSISLSSYRSEFGIVDIFLFLGFFGIVLYTLLFVSIFKTFINNKLVVSYFIITMIIVAVAGNFLYFPFNCFMFSIGVIFLTNWKTDI